MGEVSNIEWTDATWNPWQGCTKVSPACTNCYMFRDMKRYGKDPAVVRRSSDKTFRLPLLCTRHGERGLKAGTKVFTCSWADWFHEAADDWRPAAWGIVRQRPDLIIQIVTKRTDRIIDHLPEDWGDGWPNVWMIATAESQDWFDSRMEDLAKVPCAVRGLSIEPMLGPVDIRNWTDCIDWVIVGGESGPNARPTDIDWVRDVRNSCEEADIPFFFKQWGEYDERGVKVGRKRAGRLLDGVEWSEFPETQTVRK